MKLYIHPASPNCVKVLVVAKLLHVSHDIELVDLPGGAQIAPGYRSINPNAKVAALQDGEFALWGSTAIMHYLATTKPEVGLWPSDASGQADVLRWISWDPASLAAAVRPFVWERMFKLVLGQGATDEAAVTAAEGPFHQLMTVLEAALAVGRSYLAGADLTLADIAVAARLIYAEPGRMPLQDYPVIAQWRRSTADLPVWRAALPAAPGLAA